MVGMTLSLTVPPEVEAKLRERAAASGEPVDVYASKILVDAVTTPSVEEVLALARKQVAESGMTDSELDEFLQSLREKVWQDGQGGRQ